MTKTDIPVLVLSDMTVLPDTVISFTFQDQSNMMTAAMLHDQSYSDGDMTALALTRKAPMPKDGADTLDTLYPIGCFVKIKNIAQAPPLGVTIEMQGLQRAAVKKITKQMYGLSADIETKEVPELGDALKEKVLAADLENTIQQLISVLPNGKAGYFEQFKQRAGTSLQSLMANAVNTFAYENEYRQKYLTLNLVDDQFALTVEVLQFGLQAAQVRSEVYKKVQNNMDKSQRDYVLHEEMRVIGEELGDVSPESEAEEMLKKIDALQASDPVKEKMRREVGRFKAQQPGSPDANVIRGYLDVLLSMPWDKSAPLHVSLDHAKEILDRDHYGLKEVKERILEALAVRIATRGKRDDAPILCLVGPPGTGKTSIARSVAEALSVPYVRIALGGVHDEAEIRGHRRTYLGALPGRIADGLRQAGVNNPLMLLDEIDKVGGDGYHGDPQAALLEVLDPEQNRHFTDHYIDMETDLSHVLFICTANDISHISQPLYDRMEIITLSGYTANEKMHIAKEHLIPKQLASNGLAEKQVRFSSGALRLMIEGYTAEAGVRQLEREIAKVCRICVKDLYQDGEIASDKVSVKEKDISNYLGRRKFTKQARTNEDAVGAVNGLAWTQAGGTTLEIEVLILEGKGGLQITGQLGDVMKESAQIALAYARSIAGKDSEFYEEHEIHLHVPEGAIKKDGPSAGITMATAFYSALAGKKVKGDVAMTGEITLRGRVLPVGGLKEKLLAAQMAGMKTVIVSEENRPAIEELDDEITKGMKVCYVKTLEQVLSLALASERSEQ